MLSSKFWNNPAKNPTQTQYNRFQRKPGLTLETAFSKSLDEFNLEAKEYLSTRFTKILEEINAI